LFRTIRRLLLLACALVAATEAAWGAANLRTPHVALTLEAERGTSRPGEILWLALHYDLAPHWHLYWRNPGDSGEPPRVQWELPEGWQAGEIHWPVPQRIPVGPLVNYGYEDQVSLLVPVRIGAPPPSPDNVAIVAHMTWLVCREECIPESGSLTIELPTGGTAAGHEGTAATRFEAARARLSKDFPGSARYESLDDGTLQLHLGDIGWSPGRIDELWFASADWGPVAASGAQQWTHDGDGLVLSLPVGEAPAAAGSALPGLLVVTEQTGDGPVRHGFDLLAAPATPAVQGPGITLWTALIFAAIGGLLLNLMPCVLPVLAIKVLGLVRDADGAGARHGLAFAAGVLTTFAALAALLIGLRAGGAALGWGFQLQEPLVIVGLIYLMLALALNLSGVYAVGGTWTGAGQGLTGRPGLTGTFATGILAVIVASPCTAPFMGAALGFAFTRPPAEALPVLLALGIGFALPVLLLSIWPHWLRLLPAPGAWMERLRNGLAFPMYGAAAWLLWVLSQQVAAQGLAAVLAGAVVLSFALWWYGQMMHHRRRQFVVALIGASAALGLGALAATGQTQQTPRSPAEGWSAERVAQLRQQGRPVLVNFTAAWCITCQVNEQIALGTDRVRTALRDRDIAYLKGDWTRHDAAITAELQRHGRSGVPLYLLYPPGQGQPEILPQLLTAGLVLRAIDTIHHPE
jgi:thiol:disulfide interchange protein DsbD